MMKKSGGALMKFRNNLKQRLSGRHYACAEAINYTNKKILNIGCGNGAFEYLVADKVNEVVGIDIKYEDLIVAKKECEGLDNVNFVKFNLLEKDLPNNSADIVTMFDVIEHLPKDSELEILKKIHKILSFGGQVVISTPLENRTKYFDPAWYLKSRHRHYSKEQMAELLIDAGFEVEKIYTCGWFYEMFSMLLFYPFKWLLNMEVPFKKWLDGKRAEEYKTNNGFVTLFIVGKKNKGFPDRTEF